jgi:FKBP-type peptidyl-prolyl cis-trans isomerase SlyD
MNETELVVKENMVVKLTYILTADGEHLGRCNPDPIEYIHGHDQVIPGFENKVAGMKVGGMSIFLVKPQDAYGYREEDATIVIPKTEYPADLPQVLGMELQMINEDGEELPAWLTDISDDEITIDFNHPLAGKILEFEVEILGLRPATQDEIENGAIQNSDL